jgi:glycerol-3-phosphate dehydrogenase (NAD(P)+)
MRRSLSFIAPNTGWRGRRAKILGQQKTRRSVKRIAILGAGSWGTALALVLTRSRQPHEISLWVHDPELAEFLRRERENHTYLPGLKLPAQVEVANNIAAAMTGAQIVVGAFPPHTLGRWAPPC